MSRDLHLYLCVLQQEIIEMMFNSRTIVLQIPRFDQQGKSVPRFCRASRKARSRPAFRLARKFPTTGEKELGQTAQIISSSRSANAVFTTGQTHLSILLILLNEEQRRKRGFSSRPGGKVSMRRVAQTFARACPANFMIESVGWGSINFIKPTPDHHIF
jgi:hypothetical protein